MNYLKLLLITLLFCVGIQASPIDQWYSRGPISGTETWIDIPGHTWSTLSNGWSGISPIPWGTDQGKVKTANFSNIGSFASVTNTIYVGHVVASGRTTITNGIIYLSGTNPTINTTSEITLASQLIGNNGLTKLGGDVLELIGTNTYFGPTTISSGQLFIGNTNSTSPNSTYNISYDNAIIFENSITGVFMGGLSGTGNLWLTNDINTAVFITLGINNSNTTFSGKLSGSGGIIKDGSGTLTFNTTNNYTGITTLLNGNLLLNGGVISNSAVFMMNFTNIPAGTLTVTNGGMINSGTFEIGAGAATTSNTVLVTGSGTKFYNSILYVGYTGSFNNLIVTNGCLVKPLTMYIGYNAISQSNSVIVSGSTMTNSTSGITVGYGGAYNTLIINNSSRVLTAGITIGRSNTGSNYVLITDSGTLVTNSSASYVGFSSGSSCGNTLIVSNGAKYAMSAAQNIGTSISGPSNNTMIITGSGTIYTNSSTLTIGNSSSSPNYNSFIITNSAEMRVSSTSITRGLLNISASAYPGTVTFNNSVDRLNLAGGTLHYTKSGTMCTGSGTIGFYGNDNTIDVGSFILTNLSYVTGGGTVNKTGSGSLVLAQTSGYLASITQNVLNINAGNVIVGSTNGAYGFTLSPTAPGQLIFSNSLRSAVCSGLSGTSNIGLTNTSGQSCGLIIVCSTNSTYSGTLSGSGSLTIGSSLFNTTTQTITGLCTNSGTPYLYNSTLIVNGGTMSNANSDFQVSGMVIITVTNGGKIFDKAAQIGFDIPGLGNDIITVTGVGSMWTNTQGFNIGAQGGGCNLLISNGGEVINTTGNLGSSPYNGSYQHAIISDVGSLWNNTSTLTIGNAERFCDVTITNGGCVLSGGLTVGTGGGSGNGGFNCFLLITGSGSTITNTSGQSYVGVQQHDDYIMITNGGSYVSSTRLNIGVGSVYSPTDQDRNRVIVTGSGSLLSNSQSIYIGNECSQCNLSALNGSTLYSIGIEIAPSSYDVVTSTNCGITISDVGTTWTNSNFVYIGGWGYGTLCYITVTNGAHSYQNNDINIGLTYAGTTPVTQLTNGLTVISNNSLLDITGHVINVGDRTDSPGNYINIGIGGILTNCSVIVLQGTGSIFNLSGNSYIGSINLSSSDSICNFSGGILHANTNGFLFSGTGTNYFNTGGGTIDDGGFNVTNSVSNVGTDGLTKIGSGTLVMTVSNGWIGTTTVNNGTLSTTHPQGFTTNSLFINSPAIVDLNFVGTNPITSMKTNGVSVAPGTYNSVNMPDRITGTGSLQVFN